MTSLHLRSFLFWRLLLLVAMLFPCVNLSHISKTILIRFTFAFSPITVEHYLMRCPYRSNAPCSHVMDSRSFQYIRVRTRDNKSPPSAIRKYVQHRFSQ